jgi:uncharacterized protein (DUF1919 family)
MGVKLHLMIERHAINIKDGHDFDNSNFIIKIIFFQQPYSNISFVAYFNLY